MLLKGAASSQQYFHIHLVSLLIPHYALFKASRYCFLGCGRVIGDEVICSDKIEIKTQCIMETFVFIFVEGLCFATSGFFLC